MTELHRDYETRSVADLRKVGAHVYAKHPTTDVLVACFAFGDEEPWDWYPGEPVPASVRQHIEAGGVVSGHNAAFEAAIDAEIMGPRYGFPIPKPEQLDCTLARSAVQSIPLDLDRACQALGIREKKDKEGHRLMLRMCKPRKPKKGEETEGWTGGKCGECGGHGAVLQAHEEMLCYSCGGTGDAFGPIHYWVDDAASVARLASYCRQDIRAERALGKALRPLTPEERIVWLLDQRMNNRGVHIDAHFVNIAKRVASVAAIRLDAEMAEATGGAVEKATQVDRLKDFAKANGVELKIVVKERRNGEEYESEAADKEALEDLLAGELPANVRRAFEIRLDAGKASVKKLDKFESYRGPDGRARGNLQYHAAGPGRWAGRGIQLQNLIRAGVEEPGGWPAAMRDIAELAEMLGTPREEAAWRLFELVWGNPLSVVSRMMRGAVVAAPGKKLYFADYSQVEARGSVWAAGQQDMVDLFAGGGKIYEEMGAYIFDLSVDEVIELHKTKRDIIPRFCGKEAILGCGYGVGPAAFCRNAKKKGKVVLPLETGQKAVWGWREKNFRVVEYWRELEDACKAAIEDPGTAYRAGPFAYKVKGKWLQCRLPSGRIIWYRRPTIEPDAKDLEQCDTGETVPRYRWKVHYWGVNGVTKQWQKESTWGGKLLENCIQGMCRDMLARAKLALDGAGYDIVLSVHDEAISETDDAFGSASEFLSIMTDLPAWAKGFPLKAEGGEGYRYAK